MTTDTEETVKRTAQRMGQLATMIGRIGPANKDFAADLLRRRHLSRRAKPKSLLNNCNSLVRADASLRGTPFQLATPAQWLGVIANWQGSMEDSTVQGHVNFMRLALRDLLDVDKLPRALDKALYVRPPPEKIVGRLVADEDFAKLLLACCDSGKQASTLPKTELWQAVCWVSRDSGFRPEETLSLNVGDVVWDGFRGATLNLRPDAPDLKTGSRPVYVSRCVAALRTWIGLHPDGTNPQAPLFTAVRDRSGHQRMSYQSWNAGLRRLALRAGINHSTGRSKPLTPHDFRHTRATEAARGGWMEAELRTYFGWKTGSDMPSRYVRLALGDMRKRVRRDAGLDDGTYDGAMKAGDKAKALAALLNSIMSENQDGLGQNTKKSGPKADDLTPPP